MANANPFPPSRIITSAPDETRRFGIELGRRLSAGVLVLTGGLGAGKTTLVKGLAEGMGFKSAATEVSSPTFVIAREYPTRIPLVHVDLYRLESLPSETADWLSESFDREAVTVLEWGEKAAAILPKNLLTLTMTHQGENSRSIDCRISGDFRILKGER
jgi:tRNA threonylcarbamoyladenosine biosynthesis protein TsaE